MPALLQDALDAATKTRSNCDVAPDDKTAEPIEDSCLVFDFIKLAAATAAASTAGSKQGSLNPINAAGAGYSELQQQGYKNSDEKHYSLQHRSIPAQHQTLNRAVLPKVETENDHEISTLKQSMVPYGQRQQNFVSGIPSRQPSKSPLQDAVNTLSLSSDKLGIGERANWLLQDLECGQSGIDLVQVRVANLSRHESSKEVHHSARRIDRCRMSEGPFGRTWAGRDGGILAEMLQEGPHKDHGR
jgi:hypothetical protein